MPALFPHSPLQKEQRNIWENLIKAKYFLPEKETCHFHFSECVESCLLYTSDAAHEDDIVYLRGRRII